MASSLAAEQVGQAAQRSVDRSEAAGRAPGGDRPARVRREPLVQRGCEGGVSEQQARLRELGR